MILSDGNNAEAAPGIGLPFENNLGIKYNIIAISDNEKINHFGKKLVPYSVAPLDIIVTLRVT